MNLPNGPLATSVAAALDLIRVSRNSNLYTASLPEGICVCVHGIRVKCTSGHTHLSAQQGVWL